MVMHMVPVNMTHININRHIYGTLSFTPPQTRTHSHLGVAEPSCGGDPSFNGQPAALNALLTAVIYSHRSRGGERPSYQTPATAKGVTPN